jgi:2-haloalkanoic acid dehalogenase type II
MSKITNWPKAILFDFYGTLVLEDSSPIYDICTEIARTASKMTTPDKVFGEWNRIFHRLCYRSHGGAFELEREIEKRTARNLIKNFGAHFTREEMLENLYEHWKEPPIFPETREVLSNCRVPVCIVSNIDNDALSAAIEYNRLSFEMIITSENCRSYKPRPEMFKAAFELLNMKPNEVLHVGDSLFADVRGAKSFGIPVLWINNRQENKKPVDFIPEYTSPDLRIIADILDGKHPYRPAV